MDLVLPYWACRAAAPELPEGIAHLWRVRADVVDMAWRELLDSRERENVSRFRLAGDARRAIAGRGALRLLLGAYLGIPPREVVLAAEPGGKPIVAGASGERRIEFNLSHSGDWVLLAFGRGGRVGIDIERWSEIDAERIARDFFEAKEVEEWMLWPAADRTMAFFEAWALKEAYLKALGTGLAKSSRSFRVRIGPATKPALAWCADDSGAAQRWRLVKLEVERGYSAAVAAESGIGRAFSFTLSSLAGG